jgi:integrase
MAVRMIKGSWCVDFSFNHYRYRKRSPDNSKAGAKAYEALLRQKLARGERLDAVEQKRRTTLFRDFAQRWFDEQVRPNNKPSDQRSKRLILRASLLPFFGSMRIEHITAQHVERYKAAVLKTGVAQKTVNNRLTVLRKCLVTAYEWLQLEGASPKIVWLKCAPSKTDYLAANEIAALLANASGIAREMILLALRTGMRQGEIKGLQWESIDWSNRSIAVRHSKCDYTESLGPTKTNRERHIPMDEEVYAMLAKRKQLSGYVFLYSNGTPFNNNRINHLLAVVCKAAGMRKVGWHALRHTFASHLVMNGAPLPAVQALLGHSTIIMTMRYTHLSQSALRSAIELLKPVPSEFFGHPGVIQRAESDWKEAA